MRARGIGLLAAGAGIAVIAIVAALLFVLAPPCITLTVEATEAAKSPGQTVTLNVAMSGNPGFTDMTAYVDYDHERLEFVRIEDSYTVGEGTKMEYLPGTEVETDVVQIDGVDNGYVKISAIEPITKEETAIFGLTFFIRPEAEVGVATVSVFGEQFAKVKGEKTKLIDSVVSKGGILVGKATCLHVDEEKDTICDLCQAQMLSIKMFDIEQTELSFENALKLNFTFTSELMKNKKYTAYITQSKENGDVTTEVPSSEWKDEGRHRYSVEYIVRAVELTDPISITVFDDDGYCYSNACQTSAREIVMNTLAETTDEAITRMYVDLLNYGTAAQLTYQYKEDDPANGLLTAAQQAVATQEVSCTDSSVHGLNYMGANLSMDRELALNIYFDGFKGKNVLKMYAEVAYTDFRGEEVVYEIPGSDFQPYGEEQGKAYRVIVDRLAFADIKAPVAVTVYNENGTVHGSCVDSMESYIARRQSVVEQSVFMELLKLSSSVKAYLSNK